MPRENRSIMVAEIGLQVYKRDKHQPVTAGPTITRDNQMAKCKHRNITKRNQGNMTPFEPNSPTTESPEYLNTPEKKDLDLKSQAHDADRGLQEGNK